MVAGRSLPSPKFLIELGAAPHSDYPPGDPRATMHIKPHKEEVYSLRQASLAALGFIVRHGLGNGNWAGFGRVTEAETGRHVARISYNGRAWHRDGREMKL